MQREKRMRSVGAQLRWVVLALLGVLLIVLLYMNFRVIPPDVYERTRTYGINFHPLAVYWFFGWRLTTTGWVLVFGFLVGFLVGYWGAWRRARRGQGR
ncbi:hypothetical protein [Marinithermus hydrothermalis]|uniref:Uncharacterized protein n=1 Tax=Marinithermus hydrothermalis (strain DSM 14884 / JCM 11576 / T1) TaxID=869210 RepID=F2NLX6_MARHT|nr:hypothetical protein [Marinithermus hydrothermalis]AEB11233.1 hypothetical protein Marky_0481 [Marinithermus hydrothermalis DSM 14884]